LGLFAAPESAFAASVQYQLASVDLEFNDSSKGLQLYADTSVLDTSKFTLNDYEYKELDAFYIGTKEYKVDLDDKFAKPIKATFTFASPGNATAVVRGASFGTYSFFDGKGIVDFGLPDIVYTPTAVFAVSLKDVKFGTPGKALVRLKVKQLKSKGVAPVPEPASVALFVVGGAIAGLGIRRSRARSNS